VDFFPVSLKVLVFDFCFNQPIDNLPEGIELLGIGYMYNRIHKFLIPTRTSYDSWYNNLGFRQEIKKLPKNLKMLMINSEYKNELNFPNIQILRGQMHFKIKN